MNLRKFWFFATFSLLLITFVVTFTLYWDSSEVIKEFNDFDYDYSESYD